MMTFDGCAESVGNARRFVAKAFGDCPGADVAQLVASELAGNAVKHSRSGQPGGVFTVHLAAFEDRWRIRVDDGGGPDEPSVKTEADQDEAGRGLVLVAALSVEWGVLGDHYARAVWAEILKLPERAS